MQKNRASNASGRPRGRAVGFEPLSLSTTLTCHLLFMDYLGVRYGFSLYMSINNKAVRYRRTPDPGAGARRKVYPMQGSAPPQEPGTWNLAGTCTLVNTPHVTT